MADEKKEKRTLLGDIQKNIIDKIGNDNIMEGDITRYKVPEKLPEVPIKTIERSKKKVIENESEFENAFNYAMQKAYDKNVLPTKYTNHLPPVYLSTVCVCVCACVCILCFVCVCRFWWQTARERFDRTPLGRQPLH